MNTRKTNSKKIKQEKKYFTFIAKVLKWDVDLSCSKWTRDKDWPRPSMHDGFIATAELVVSDYPSTPVGSAIKVYITTDYEYMVYHLKKDYRFADSDRPDDEHATISYDEYMKKSEENSRKIVGYMEKHNGNIRAYLTCPAEFTVRLASLLDKIDLYIDIHAYNEGRTRDPYIQGIRVFSDFDLEDY